MAATIQKTQTSTGAIARHKTPISSIHCHHNKNDTTNMTTPMASTVTHQQSMITPKRIHNPHPLSPTNNP
jgi:hypothetical protein